MFFEFHFIDILFNVSIFALLTYQVYSLVKKYLIPLLFQQLQSEKNEHTHIIEKHRLLISTRHRLQNQIYNQKNVFTLLERNVQVWYKMVMEERCNEEAAHKRLIETIREKRNEQKKNINVKKNIQFILPKAIDKARTALEKKHTGLEGKKTLAKILQGLS